MCEQLKIVKFFLNFVFGSACQHERMHVYLCHHHYIGVPKNYNKHCKNNFLDNIVLISKKLVILL